MVDKNPGQEMVMLAFSPENMGSMAKIMHNPIRQISDVQLQGAEALVWSVAATEGNAYNLPAALSMFLLERLEDPIKIARIILNDTMRGG